MASAITENNRKKSAPVFPGTASVSSRAIADFAAVRPGDIPADHLHTNPYSHKDQPSELARSGTMPAALLKDEPALEPRLSLEARESAELEEDSKGVLQMSHAGRWTQVEHQRLLEALDKYGNLWKKVCEYVGTRNPCQARSHAQKYFSKLKVKEMRKVRNSAANKRKIFAVTREYLNRTVAPARLLEVPENVYRRVDSVGKRISPEEEPQKGRNSTPSVLSPANNIIPPVQQRPPLVMPTLYTVPMMPGQRSQPQFQMEQQRMYMNGAQCVGVSPFCMAPPQVLSWYPGLFDRGPFIYY